MTYRTKTLLGAVFGLVLMAGLGAYAYFGVHQKGKQEHRDEVMARLALNLHANQVQRIEMERGARRVALIRSGLDDKKLALWRMVEPVEADGDDVAINSLLGILERMDAERRLTGAEIAGPDSFGLASPRARWRLTMEDGRVLSLLVGKKSPFNDRLYLQLEGEDGVLLVKGHLQDALLKRSYDLRRKALTSLEPQRVERLTLRTTEQEIIAEKREGRWQLTQPLADRADAASVERMLNVLRNLRAKAFTKADIPDSAYGLKTPLVRVIAEVGPDRQALEVWFGRGTLPSNGERVFAVVKQADGLRAEVASYQASAFMKKVFDLQAKAPMEFDRDAVARIKIVSRGELLVLEKNKEVGGDGGVPSGGGAGWALVSPLAAPAKLYKVNAILGALSQLRATGFLGRPEALDLDQVGLARPVRSVVLYSENGNEISTLKIGKADSKGVRVLGTAREQVCLVDAARLAALDVSAADLRDDPAPTAPPAGPAAMPAPNNP